MDERKLPQMPRLNSEGEEAKWWFSLDPEDEALARAQAERRGLEYKDYVKIVAHQALLMEEM